MSTHNTREGIEGNISFKAIAKQSVDGTCRKGDWVCGNLISNNGRPFIVGDVVESDEEYILFEFWVPVEKESITSLVPEQTHHRELQKARDEEKAKLAYEVMTLVHNALFTPPATEENLQKFREFFSPKNQSELDQPNK